MPYVALATCKNIPEPDNDEPFLVAALGDLGVEARVLPWDDEAVDWSAPTLVVIRSTWNYYLRPQDFLSWARAQGERLLNDVATVTWNHHKRYLRELANSGLPVVPTLWLPKGTAATYATLFAAQGWTDVVVKPAVSAGSYRTSRLLAPEFDQEAVKELVDDGDVMVQPYIASVEGYGERSLVCIDGEITHAIRKAPRFVGQREVVSEVMPIADEERRLALEVFRRDRLLPSPLYARIDMVRDAEGQPMLSEVELIEPSLFLQQSPEALERFAGAIAARFRSATAP